MTQEARHEWIAGLLFILLLNCTIVVTVVCLFFWMHSAARAQDTSHTHEGEVGKFYQTWKQPDTAGFQHRYSSCCNNVDCRPITEVRRASGGGNTSFEVMIEGRWYRVRDSVWEDQQPDPRESPDGRAHGCVRNGVVVCAVRGSDG